MLGTACTHCRQQAQGVPADAVTAGGRHRASPFTPYLLSAAWHSLPARTAGGRCKVSPLTLSATTPGGRGSGGGPGKRRKRSGSALFQVRPGQLVYTREGCGRVHVGVCVGVCLCLEVWVCFRHDPVTW